MSVLLKKSSFTFVKKNFSYLLRSAFFSRPKHAELIVLATKFLPKVAKMIPAYTNGHGHNDCDSSHLDSDSEDSDALPFYPYELRPLPTQVSASV